MKAPHPSFRSQVAAMYLRKFIHYRRSRYALISSALPLVFILVGSLLVKDTYSPDDKQAQITNAINFIFNIIFGVCINLSPFCGFAVNERENNMR